MAKKRSAKKSKAEKAAASQTAKKSSAQIGVPKWLYGIMFAFGFLLYANTITHEYAVDDLLVITKNNFTQQGFGGIGDIMTTDAFEGHFGERGKKLVAGGRYRPLSIVTFAIEYGILGEENPSFSHLINAVLYGLLGIVLLAVLLQFFPASSKKPFYQGFAFLITVFYLAHPLHTEAVANIKGRDEVMGMLFSCLALWLILKYVAAQQMKYIWMMVPVYLAALLSKENAITFLAVVPLSLYTFTNAKKKDYGISVGMMFACAAVFLLMRASFTGSDLVSTTKEVMNDPFAVSTLSERFGTVFLSFLQYLKLLFAPYPLTHDYYPFQIPKRDLLAPLPMISVLIHVGLFVWAAMKIRQKNIIAYGILFYFLTFSVVSNFFFTIGTTMSERFMFMPSLGFSIAFVYGLKQLLDRFIKGDTSKAFSGLVMVIVAVFAILTIQRNPDWKNNYVLFSRDVKTSTNSAKLNMAYAGELLAQAPAEPNIQKRNQMYREAIQHLDKAIEIYPEKDLEGRPIGYANAYNLLGNAHYSLNKDFTKALDAYNKAATYLPGHFDAYQNSVVILIEQQRYQDALTYLHSLRASAPQNPKFLFQMGTCYENLGKFDSAVASYQQVVKLDPTKESDVYYKIGLVFAKYQGKMDDGIRYLEMAAALAPNNVHYLEDLGVAYAFDQQSDKAIGIFEKILDLNPQYANAYINLAAAYRAKGDEAKANYYQQKAAELQQKSL